MMLLDSSGLLAALDAGQRQHAQAAASLDLATPPLLLSPFVLAEVDELLATHVGDAARSALLAEVQRGAYQLQAFSAADVGDARAIIERHGQLGVSLADASICVLAARHATHDVLTLDEHRFRLLTVGGQPLRLLPADA